MNTMLSTEKILRELHCWDDAALRSEPTRTTWNPSTPFEEFHMSVRPDGVSHTLPSKFPPHQPAAKVFENVSCRVESTSDAGTCRITTKIQSKSVVVERSWREVHQWLRDLEEEAPYLSLPTCGFILGCGSVVDESHLEWIIPFVLKHCKDNCCATNAAFILSQERPFVRRPQPSMYRSHAPTFVAAQASGFMGMFSGQDQGGGLIAAEAEVMIGLSAIDATGVLGALYLAVTSQVQSLLGLENAYSGMRPVESEWRGSMWRLIPTLRQIAIDVDSIMGPQSPRVNIPVEDEIVSESSILLLRRLRILHHLGLSMYLHFHRVVELHKDVVSSTAALQAEFAKKRLAGMPSNPPLLGDTYDRMSYRLT
eukprot:PhF_6_TR14905/c0_g1_i2/m.23269